MQQTNVFDEHGNLTPEEEERRRKYAAAAMQQAGERTEDIVEVDFFGCDERRTVFLPGSSSQYVVVKEFTEGDRKKYLDRTNKDVRFSKGGDASMKASPGSDRHELLRIAIVDFHLLKAGTPVTQATHPRALDEFLDKTSPRVIDHIVKEVHKLNPWLLAEMTVEDIEKEIADLEEMLEVRKKEEAKNDSSTSR